LSFVFVSLRIAFVFPVELPALHGGPCPAVPALERRIGLAVVLVAVEAGQRVVVRGPGAAAGQNIDK
jgi:hypothetical protein